MVDFVMIVYAVIGTAILIFWVVWALDVRDTLRSIDDKLGIALQGEVQGEEETE